MRSRYAAYARGEVDHVWRTWHPRTRPERVVHDPTTTWTGLEVLRAEDDVVEFVASHRSPDGVGKGLASSITATLAKIADDAQRATKHYSDLKSADLRDPGEGHHRARARQGPNL